METPELSIVVPVYNEEISNLYLLLERLNAVLSPLLVFYEIVFIDDGSKKETADAVRQLPNKFPYVRAVFLSRNFGEQSAICAGYAHARGEIIINMDSDLQDPPDLIPTMLQHWRDGHDVVSTKQVNRHDPLPLLILINAFYWTLKRFSPTTVVNAGEFRLLSRRAADALLSLPERTIFLRHLVPWIGFKQITIVFERQKRIAGSSSYSFWKLLKLGFLGLLSSSSFPLIVIPLCGIIIIILCIALHIFIHAQLFSVSSKFIFLGAAALVNMISITMLAGYVAVTLNESRGRPRYIVADIVENTCVQTRLQQDLAMNIPYKKNSNL